MFYVPVNNIQPYCEDFLSSWVEPALKGYFYCGKFLLFMFHLCLYYAALSVPCNIVITCWEMADILTLLCVVFSCVFVTLPYFVPGQLWYLIESTPDLCHCLYFKCDFIYLVLKYVLGYTNKVNIMLLTESQINFYHMTSRLGVK